MYRSKFKKVDINVFIYLFLCIGQKIIDVFIYLFFAVLCCELVFLSIAGLFGSIFNLQKV